MRGLQECVNKSACEGGDVVKGFKPLLSGFFGVLTVGINAG